MGRVLFFRHSSNHTTVCVKNNCASRKAIKSFASGDMLVHKDAPIDRESMKIHGERFYNLEVAVTQQVAQKKGVSRCSVLSC